MISMDNKMTKENGIKVRLVDIAAAAGVSASAVSKALKNSPEIPPATRKKILDTANALGYRPNFIARSLRLGRTNLLGILIPDNTNPYYSCILKGIETKGRALGFTTIIANTNENADDEADALSTFQSLPVDGILTVPVSFENYAAVTTPLVFLSRYPLPKTHSSQDAGSDNNYVMSDDRKGQYLAVSHLIECGIRDIYIFLDESDSRFVSGAKTQIRLSGFQSALADAGYKFDKTHVIYQISTFEAAFRAVSELCVRAKPPFGICLTNDAVAIGALNAIHACNLRIPEDVQVVGYDDIDLSQFLVPPLTTVHSAKQSIGETGVSLIRDIINSESQQRAKAHMVFEPFLVQRSSTKPLSSAESPRKE